MSNHILGIQSSIVLSYRSSGIVGLLNLSTVVQLASHIGKNNHNNNNNMLSVTLEVVLNG